MMELQTSILEKKRELHLIPGFPNTGSISFILGLVKARIASPTSRVSE